MGKKVSEFFSKESNVYFSALMFLLGYSCFIIYVINSVRFYLMIKLVFDMGCFFLLARIYKYCYGDKW